MTTTDEHYQPSHQPGSVPGTCTCRDCVPAADRHQQLLELSRAQYPDGWAPTGRISADTLAAIGSYLVRCAEVERLYEQADTSGEYQDLVTADETRDYLDGDGVGLLGTLLRELGITER
jgi:hypothetical protein